MRCPKCNDTVHLQATYDVQVTVACTNCFWEEPIEGTYLERWINKSLNADIPGHIVLKDDGTLYRINEEKTNGNG